jgi:hypothetical protein
LGIVFAAIDVEEKWNSDQAEQKQVDVIKQEKTEKLVCGESIIYVGRPSRSRRQPFCPFLSEIK